MNATATGLSVAAAASALQNAGILTVPLLKDVPNFIASGNSLEAVLGKFELSGWQNINLKLCGL